MQPLDAVIKSKEASTKYYLQPAYCMFSLHYIHNMISFFALTDLFVSHLNFTGWRLHQRWERFLNDVLLSNFLSSQKPDTFMHDDINLF